MLKNDAGAGLYYPLRTQSLPRTNFRGESTLPFVSEKQRAKFAQLVKEGKMSQETFDKWQSETGETKLPKKATVKTKGLIRGVRKTR